MNPKLIKKAIILEVIGLVFAVIATLLAVLYAAFGPDSIPAHYDFAGNIDGYGSPYILLLMPLSLLFCNAIVAISVHLIPPSKWNMPFRIKEGCEVKVYRDSAEMCAKVELVLSVYSLLFTICMIFQQAVLMIGLSFWLCLVLAFVIITSMMTMKKHNK